LGEGRIGLEEERETRDWGEVAFGEARVRGERDLGERREGAALFSQPHGPTHKRAQLSWTSQH
jgi:hypothetical protein